MLPRPWLHSAAIGLAFVLLLPLATAPVHADQFLSNGDFEAGGDSWSPRLGFSPSACEGRSGGAGGALETSVGEQTAFLQQTVAGPFGDGDHTLSGYARLEVGELESAGADLAWLDAGGEESASFVGAFTPGADYAAFEIGAIPPAGAAQMRVRVSITATAAATLCLDDLRLDGPSPPTPTATASQTPTATATDTPAAIASPTPTETPTLIPVDTATPGPSPSATLPASATPAATTTPTPTQAPTASATALAAAFVNGGFEDELVGWRKQGGELRLTAAPVRSGAVAAAFFSETASTKWAYQTARIDPALGYEFQGYVQTGAGVSESYLRISWYESGDGSGRAIATVDSLTRVGGGSADFLHLTTGAVRPPAGAASARLRVMLAPVAAATAVVYLDDFRFGPAALVASIPTATPTAALANPRATLVPPPAAAPAIAASEQAAPSSSPVAVSAAAGADSAVAAVTAAPREPARLATPAEREREGSGPSLLLIGGVGLPLFFSGLGAAYFLGRRWRRI